MNKLSYPSSTHLKKMIRNSQVFRGEFREGMKLLKTNSKEGPCGGTCILKISATLTIGGRSMTSALTGVFE